MLISDFCVNCMYYLVEVEIIRPVIVVALIKNSEVNKFINTKSSYSYPGAKEEDFWMIGYLLGKNCTSVTSIKEDRFDSIFEREEEAKACLKGRILNAIESKYEKYVELLTEKGVTN